MKGWMDGCLVKERMTTDGWIMDGQMDRRMDESTEGWVMDGWMDGWIDGWMMDGWMNG